MIILWSYCNISTTLKRTVVSSFYEAIYIKAIYMICYCYLHFSSTLGDILTGQGDYLLVKHIMISVAVVELFCNIWQILITTCVIQEILCSTFSAQRRDVENALFMIMKHYREDKKRRFIQMKELFFRENEGTHYTKVNIYNV